MQVKCTRDTKRYISESLGTKTDICMGCFCSRVYVGNEIGTAEVSRLRIYVKVENSAASENICDGRCIS